MSKLFTITEAAAACNVSKRTIRRKLEAEALQGAYQDAKGIWHIPLEDLLSAGYTPNKAESQDTAQGSAQEAQGSDIDLVALEKELQAERERRIAAESKLEVIQDALNGYKELASLAQRQLSAGPMSAPTKKRRFFSRS